MEVNKRAFGTFVLILLSVVALCALLPAQTQKKKTVKDLPPQYQKWLQEEVVYIITAKERDVFLQLESDRERSIFIEAFWKQRNPDTASTENKFRVEHYRRIGYANQWFGRNSPTRGWRTDMGRIYIILGEPKAKEIYENDPQLRPFVMWFYDGMSEYGLPGSFYVAFWKKDIVDDYRLYSPINDGPQNLLIHFAGDMAQHEEAYRQLLKISPNVAEVSLSLIPGESRFMAAPSMASEILIRQNIPRAPQEKIKDEYAEKLLKYKNIIEVDYTSNYIDNDAMIQVFQDPAGLSFVHYLIEPRRLTFEQTQRGTYRSQLEINGRITDTQGRSIYQFDRSIPMQISEGQMAQIRTRLFSLQDLFPMSPGQYKVNLLVKNVISKEFTSVEADLLIPEPTAFSMSAPILAYRADKDSKFKGSNKPFLLGNVQFVPSPRNVFMPSDTMFLFFQLHGLPNELRTGGSVVYTILKQNETMKVPEPVKTISRDLKDMPDLRAVMEEFPLAALPAAHYILNVAIRNAGNAEKLKAQVSFDIRGAQSLNRAWVVSLPQPPSDDPSFANILGAQYLAKQDLAKARPLLESAYRRDPGSEKYALDYSRALAEAKDFRGVVEVIRPYLADERKYEFLQLAGDASRELGLYADAIARYKDYLAHFGTNIAILNSVGDSYVKLESPAEALVAWERSLQLEPNQPAIRDKVKALKDKK